VSQVRAVPVGQAIVADRTAAHVAPKTSAPPAIVAPRNGRVAGALVRTVLCMALLHVALVIAHAAVHRDVDALNVFSVLEAQRLWPGLVGGPGALAWSLAFAAAVFGVAYAWTGAAAGAHTRPAPHARGTQAGRTPASSATPSTNGVVSPAVAAAVRDAAVPATRIPLAAGIAALVGGLAVHMTALAAIERFVDVFPPVPDVVQAALPYVDFGVPGELAYLVFMVAMTIVLVRTQPRSVPSVLVLLGIFYAVRGCFLFLLPIGAPPTAPGLDERFVFWPFPGHAYFPGGHTGMMTVLSLSVVATPWRRAFLVATAVFAIGTVLARTHYSADALGGWLTGYAIVLWGRHRLRATGHAVRDAAVRPRGLDRIAGGVR